MSFLNDFNLFALAKRIKRPLILDGAMGSLLQQRGIKPHPQLWMSHANLLFPDRVLEAHKEYIEAGADIITTNTFRTNPSSAEHAGKYNLKAAVQIARDAVGDKAVLIAGSNSPAEDCYQRERKLTISNLEYNHAKHIDLLMDSGADFILNETQSHLDEIRIICKYCVQNRIPFILSLFFDPELRLLSGENVSDVLNLVMEHAPLAVGFNCIKPGDFRNLVKNRQIGNNTGFYFNCGTGKYDDNEIKSVLSPSNYASEVKDLLSTEPSFIGACCGSNPSHIRALRNIFLPEVITLKESE